jgi:uncharacterized protein (TIGR02391 family)
MLELPQVIPDVDLLLKLEPEELAAKMLFLMRKRGGPFHFVSLLDEMFEKSHDQRQYPYSTQPHQKYPIQRQTEISRAVAEAWAWLEAQGLVVPEPGTNGQQGWRFLSRRAQTMENESDFADYKIARLLPKEMLHPKIAEDVWLDFMRGDYDMAVFRAMKAAEVEVRKAGGYPDGLLGVKLMREAFAPKGGPLTDMNAEEGERQGRSDLFAGAIASYKNPNSHRDVNLNDPREAIETILLANHLLRIVEMRAQKK